MKDYVFAVPPEKGGGWVINMAESENKARENIRAYYNDDIRLHLVEIVG